ncbi:GNAT family N-acetyltransferase [Clostridium manihotivorum]|uniref:GNAT family N-acetyltransferase n=1 Tax=Clostridium manihotivorum TaxID=2320868 RepID=A0A410DX64_9CLOT|nr:GNAT family N-acetyltransferase [Clostridium manihotivorum]QAA33709.1 GNAT family N-acetyltransferase [Clostridium manihotivorum]
MIKNYLELSEREIKRVYEYQNKDKIKYSTIEEMDKAFKSDLFNFGEGILFNFKNNDICSSLNVLLKECPIKFIAYGFELSVSNHIEDKTSAIKEIVEAAKTLAKLHKAKEFYLGIADSEIVNLLNSLNYFEDYYAIKMVLEDISILYPTLNLIPLCEENKEVFLDIDNEAFSEAPNGKTTYIEEVDEYIRNADDNNCYFIAEVDGQAAGFLLFEVKDGKALFDLGLKKSYRGKGYGKMLLETAIDFLNKKNADEIGLIVITKNTLAYNMYIKRGFKEQKSLSSWFPIF